MPDNTPRAYLQQLKQLRSERGSLPKEMIERGKSQISIQKTILAAIETEYKTVPEIAELTGLDTQDVFWWITALRKYNRVQDGKKRGEYATYLKK
ncbi:MAG: hypothetical protein ACYC1M_09815 [Armatimonadota bacterium]